MTHFEPMQESDGQFNDEKVVLKWCEHCNGTVKFKCETWDSSCGGYTDHKYTCLTCGHGYWVDGGDS